MTDFAVDHYYFSGCWDSNGHEEIKVRRYKCDTIEEAKSRYDKLLSQSSTKSVKILRYNPFRKCFEVFVVGSPDIFAEENDDREPTLPVGFVDRRKTVQSQLF